MIIDGDSMLMWLREQKSLMDRDASHYARQADKDERERCEISASIYQAVIDKLIRTAKRK